LSWGYVEALNAIWEAVNDQFRFWGDNKKPLLLLSMLCICQMKKKKGSSGQHQRSEIRFGKGGKKQKIYHNRPIVHRSTANSASLGLPSTG